jgi:CRISPR-associated protein Cas2
VVDPDKWTEARHRLLEIYDPEEDSLRFYFLGAKWRGRVEHHGAKAIPDPEGVLIV